MVHYWERPASSTGVLHVFHHFFTKGIHEIIYVKYWPGTVVDTSDPMPSNAVNTLYWKALRPGDRVFLIVSLRFDLIRIGNSQPAFTRCTE